MREDTEQKHCCHMHRCPCCTWVSRCRGRSETHKDWEGSVPAAPRGRWFPLLLKCKGRAEQVSKRQEAGRKPYWPPQLESSEPIQQNHSMMPWKGEKGTEDGKPKGSGPS